jgi:hypothetical protein
MRYFTLIGILLIHILSRCSPDKKDLVPGFDSSKIDLPKNGIISPKLKITAQPGGTRYQDSFLIIYIVTTIENISADTVKFLSWTCSYENMFLVNDTLNFVVQSRYDCYSNVPCFIYLPPKHKTNRYIMLRQLGSFKKLHEDPIRVGMKLTLQKTSFTGSLIEYTKIKTDDIIWSNELKMARLTKEIYIE